MSDARSLLRAQRSARRIEHPLAAYSESGKLSCTLCNVIVKSDSLWPSHVQSSGHVARADTAVVTISNGLESKKRKATLDQIEEDEARKRVRAPEADDTESTEQPRGSNGGPTDERFAENAADPDTVTPVHTEDNHSEINAATVALPDDDEDWLAFQRELGKDLAAGRPSALTAGPTISAAPMTAQEVAAQARADMSVQREDRAAELAAEQEDAARALDDEIEQMDALEIRLQRLREQREALRQGSASTNSGMTSKYPAEMTISKQQSPSDQPITTSILAAIDPDKQGPDEIEDDDEEDHDDWQFGTT